MTYLDKPQLEIVTVDYLCELGYSYVHGPDMAPDGEAPERASDLYGKYKDWSYAV